MFPSTSHEAPARVRRARARLEIAGRALDPNGIESGPDPETALSLLDAAAVDALGVLLGAPEDLSRSELRKLLADADVLPDWDERIVDTLLDETTRSSVDPRDAERAVSRLVVRVDAHRRSARKRRIALLIVLALAVIGGGLALGLERFFPPASNAYAWRASSAYGDFPRQGTLGQRHDGLTFHTNEELHPSIEIDAGKMVSMKTISITNRSDCCFERATPLVVEVAGDDHRFEVVGRRDTPFGTWDLSFEKRNARYVRLSVPHKTIFHLEEIRIR